MLNDAKAETAPDGAYTRAQMTVASQPSKTEDEGEDEEETEVPLRLPGSFAFVSYSVDAARGAGGGSIDPMGIFENLWWWTQSR